MFRIPRRLTFDQYLFEVQEMLCRLGGWATLETSGLGNDVILRAKVAIGDDVVLDVLEVVKKTADGRAHRTKYRYKCFLEGSLVFRYEFEPQVHPEMPLQKHVPPDGTRTPWHRVGLAEVVRGMWDEIDAERRRRSAAARLSA
jgi:hypothetical protein